MSIRGRTDKSNQTMNDLKDGGAVRSLAILRVKAALDETDGNVSAVARKLGVHYLTAFRMVHLAELADYASSLRAKAKVGGPRRVPKRKTTKK